MLPVLGRQNGGGFMPMFATQIPATTQGEGCFDRGVVGWTELKQKGDTENTFNEN